VLRRPGTQVTRAATRRFNQIAWPAFAPASPGIRNIAAEQDKITGSYRTTVIAKLVAVLAPGVTASLHARSRSTAGLAVFGALTGATAPAALFLAILRAG
jgi:hypothetical protein